jgi:hypothetical protein
MGHIIVLLNGGEMTALFGGIRRVAVASRFD